MKMTGDVAAFAKALCAAQKEMPDAKMDGLNDHFNSRYSTLTSVKNAVMPVLTKHGFAVSQTFREPPSPGVVIITTLMHESGATGESDLFMPVDKSDPQKVVAAITYGRRASLAAICGCVEDEDDDGNRAAGKNGGKAQAQQRSTQPTLPPATPGGGTPAQEHMRAEVARRLYAMTPNTMNENARTDAAKGYLSAILPGKTSTAQLTDLDADRVMFALDFIPRLGGPSGRSMAELVSDANSYLASQWTMEPIHQLSKLQIDAARTRMAAATPTTGQQQLNTGPNF